MGLLGIRIAIWGLHPWLASHMQVPPQQGEGNSLKEGERRLGGCSKQRPWIFTHWVVAGTEEESSLLGSAIVSGYESSTFWSPSSVQFSQSCPTLCNPMDCSTPGFPVHHQLPELAQTHVHELVMPSNHLILCRPLLLLPSIFPSIKVFSNESVLPIRRPKYWSFSFSINPSNEYSGLISFRIDWFDLLAVQGTHTSLLQHHCLKTSILWCSAFFMVQLSHPYMTTGKTILNLIEVLKVKVKLAQSYQLFVTPWTIQ